MIFFHKGLIFPSGHVESNESVVDSVIREIKEETGLAISNDDFCGIKDWLELDGSRYMVFLYKTIHILAASSHLQKAGYSG